MQPTSAYRGRMRRLAVIVAIAAVVPALALAAPAGRYAGRTEGGGKVTFKVSGGKVRGFRVASVVAICPSGLTQIQAYVPAARIRNGRFYRRYTPIRSVDQNVTLRGRFRGGKASGTVKGGPTCVYSQSWRARKR
jgi:hypothetical protein